MRLNRIMSAAVLIAVAGLASNLRADDNNRPLPSHDDVAVSMDDAVRLAEDSYPALKLADAKLVKHGNRWVYQIQMLRGNKVRTLKVDCSTGQTIVNKNATAGSALLGKLRSEVEHQSTVAISKADAIQAAEASVPGAKAYEVELDDLNDVAVFKVKLLDGTRRVTVYVNANTGKVVDQAGDGVVNLSLDEAAAKAAELFPDWKVIKIELSDDRDDDDSGSAYKIRMINAAGTQRRDVRLDANTGAVLQDRIRNVANGNVNGFHDLAGLTPQITPTEAGVKASDSVPGSRVREVSLKVEHGVLVYEVHLINATGGDVEIKVNAMTGDLLSGSPGGGGTPATITYTQAAMIASDLFPALRVREVELETEHGTTVYKVQMVDDSGNRTDVFIDATTGAVVGNPSGTDDSPDGGTATISYADASRIALGLFPDLTVREVELETEHGVLLYKVQMMDSGGVRSEVLIDATTGTVVGGDDGGGPGGGGNPVDSSQASAIALALFPGSTIREVSTDTEEGVPVYEVSLNTSSGRVDVKIAIATGAVVRVRSR